MQCLDHTKQFKYARSIEEANFIECPTCHEFFIGNTETHQCPPNTSCKRIEGIWLVEDVKIFPQMTKIHCVQGDERLVHVIFEDNVPIKTDDVVEFKGWQNTENRYNSLVFVRRHST